MSSSSSSQRLSKDYHPVPLLQHRTGARFGSDTTQSWIKSLPDCFLNSEEGVVGSLISFVSRLFELVTSTLREAGHLKYADNLGMSQRRFALWRDKKDVIDKKLDGSSKTRDAVAFQLSNLVLVLGQGLSPSRCTIQLDLVKSIHQCLEQASELISDDLGQVPYDSETHLINSFTEAISKIHKSITSLFDLSKDIDLITKEAFDIEHRCFPASVQATGLSFFELLSKHYPAASAKTIRRASNANQERLRILRARLEVVNGRSGPICSANSNVQISGRPRSISDGSTASGSNPIDDERPPTSSETSASVHRTSHSLLQKIGTDWNWVNSNLHCPWCEASFKTQAALEDHILVHMKLYHCSSSACMSGLPFFDSAQECLDHEFEYHRMIQYCWTCASCKIQFHQKKELEDHLLQNHCIDVTSAGWKELLEKSHTKLFQPIEEEVCDFCLAKSFSTREDFATHFGKHMEQISSLIVLSIIPQKDEISAEFTQLIKIWDYRNNEFMEFYAKLDTAADYSFISRSIVVQLCIPTRKLNEKLSIRTANNVKIEVNEWAEPKWRTLKKNYRDSRFLILEEIPGREQMILGKDFLKAKAPVWHETFVLQNDGQGLSSEEQRRHEIQSLDDKANQERRKAAIKAKRDQIGKPAGQQSEPTVKDFLPNGKEEVK